MSPETIEKMRIAGKLAAQAMREAAVDHRARRHHRRGRPGRARVPLRPRRLPVDPRLQGLPQVAVHLGQRVHLPRHPRRPRARGRRHRQHRHHRLHRRRARRHQRDLPRRRRRRGEPPAGRAHRGVAAPGDQRGQAGPPGQRDRPGHRVVRQALRLRRRHRLHRARRQHVVPLRADHPALRRRAVRHRDGARA